MKKVKRGDALSIAASDWNHVADAVDYVRAQQNNEQGCGVANGYTNGIICGCNNSSSDIPIYSVVAIGKRAPAVPDYDGTSEAVASDPCFEIAPVTDEAAAYGITQEVIPATAAGRVRILGETPVRFDAPAEGNFAMPLADSNAMQISDGGSARILAAPSEANLWGVVLLGGGGGGGTITETLLPWTVRKFTEQNEAGDEVTVWKVYKPHWFRRDSPFATNVTPKWWFPIDAIPAEQPDWVAISDQPEPGDTLWAVLPESERCYEMDLSPSSTVTRKLEIGSWHTDLLGGLVFDQRFTGKIYSSLDSGPVEKVDENEIRLDRVGLVAFRQSQFLALRTNGEVMEFLRDYPLFNIPWIVRSVLERDKNLIYVRATAVPMLVESKDDVGTLTQVDVTQMVAYNPPTDVDLQGSLNASTFSMTVLDPTKPTTSTILKTEVEASNESTTYEDV